MKKLGRKFKDNMLENNLKRMSTGFKELDECLNGGYCCQSITQILGPPRSGKTLLTHLSIRHFLENSKARVLYLSPVDDSKILLKRLESKSMEQRVHYERILDEKMLINVLSKLDHDLEIKGKSKEKKTQNLFRLTSSSRISEEERNPLEKLKKDNESIGMVVIEEIGYLLFCKEEGYEFLMGLSRSIGSCLRKISAKYNIPIIVTSIIESCLAPEIRYTYSPWFNFVGETIELEKATIKDPLGQERKYILRPFMSSTSTRFYLNKAEMIPKFIKVSFKAKISNLSGCSHTQRKKAIEIEKLVSSI